MANNSCKNVDFFGEESFFSPNTLTNGITSCKIILQSKENMTKVKFVEYLTLRTFYLQNLQMGLKNLFGGFSFVLFNAICL